MSGIDVSFDLTDSEWMDLIDGSEERTASGRQNLGVCCANVSALRDACIALARNGGRAAVFEKSNFERTLAWVLGSHDGVEDIPALQKLIAAFGSDTAALRDAVHEAQGFET